MTSEAVYRDEAISVGKVLGETSDADIGFPTRGPVQSTDTFLLKRTSGGVTDTGYASAATLQTYFNTGVDDTNYEVLSGNKTLSITSPRNQFLSGGGGARNITLDVTTEVTGTTFFIVQALSSGSLVIKSSGGTTLTTLNYAGEGVRYTWSGAAWVPTTVPTPFITSGVQYFGLNYDATPPTSTVFGVGSVGKTNITSTGVGVSASGTTPSSLFHVSAAGNANALLVDDTTGFVGIGQSPNTYALTVKGPLGLGFISSSGDATGHTMYVNDGTRYFTVRSASAQIALGAFTSHSIDLLMNNAAVGRIQTTGEFSWGTTTSDVACIATFSSITKVLGIPCMPNATITALTPAGDGNHGGIAISSDNSRLYVFVAGDAWHYISFTA